MTELAECDGVKPHEFIGQATKSATSDAEAVKGLNQQRQQEVLAQFNRGEYNVLVATSIAEEGLDIAEVDLIIFFDIVSSPVRMVQRMGRTGRRRRSHSHAPGGSRGVGQVREGPQGIQKPHQGHEESSGNQLTLRPAPLSMLPQHHPHPTWFREDGHRGLSPVQVGGAEPAPPKQSSLSSSSGAGGSRAASRLGGALGGVGVGVGLHNVRSIDTYFHPPGIAQLGSLQAASSSRPVMGKGTPRASPEYSSYGYDTTATTNHHHPPHHHHHQQQQQQQLQFHGRSAGEGISLAPAGLQTSHGKGQGGGSRAQTAFSSSSLSAAQLDPSILADEEDEEEGRDLQAAFDRGFGPTAATATATATSGAAAGGLIDIAGKGCPAP